MKNNILILSLLFFTTLAFSQKEDGKTPAQVDSIEIKKTITPMLVTAGKSELLKLKNFKDGDTLPKPELKSFAIYRRNTVKKNNDSIAVPKPELIPYSGYKKDNDN